MENEIPKALENYINKMQNTAQEILVKVFNDNLGGTMTFDIDSLNQKYPNLNMDLLLEILNEQDEIRNAHIERDNLVVRTENDYANYPETFLDEACLDEIEIMCARHILWIYDAPYGERADFSGHTIHNIDFTNKNLCGAILSNANFKNCNFDEVALCNCDIINSTFENCSFKRAVIEEADLTGSYFDETDFSKASLLHSAFGGTQFNVCNFESASAYRSYVENMQTTNCHYAYMCFDDCTTNFDEYSDTISMEMS